MTRLYEQQEYINYFLWIAFTKIIFRYPDFPTFIPVCTNVSPDWSYYYRIPVSACFLNRIVLCSDLLPYFQILPLSWINMQQPDAWYKELRIIVLLKKIPNYFEFAGKFDGRFHFTGVNIFITASGNLNRNAASCGISFETPSGILNPCGYLEMIIRNVESVLL